MSLKENLKSKMRIDRLARQILATVRETPGERKLNQDATRKLLQMTDYEYSKVRGLHLYVAPVKGGELEVVVLDNELPIYHSTVEDVTMRRAPRWKEMVSIRNIKKVLNDEDILVSRGKASIERIRTRAAAQLDLSYTRNDMEELVTEVSAALAARSTEQIQELFEMFFELLPFRTLRLDILPSNLLAFARFEGREATAEYHKDLILFDTEKAQVKLLKGRFSPRSDLDLARLLQCIAGERAADLDNISVFSFLAELALQNR